MLEMKSLEVIQGKQRGLNACDSIYSNMLVHHFTVNMQQQQFLVWVTLQQRRPHDSPC